MDQGSARTVREIQAIRDRLDDELDALADTLPPRDVLVRNAIVAAAGGLVAVFGLWYVAHRLRVRSDEKRLKRLVREALREAGVTGR